MHPDFAEIKRTTDIVAVVGSYGIALRMVGADHVGLCPFHDDTTPSLRVTQAKGLFRCPACGATGNVIQFVAKKEGITDREAALKILGDLPNVVRASELPVLPPVPGTPPPDLFTAAIDHYHAALFSRDTRGLDYLKTRGLVDVETLRHFEVGFVTGGLKSQLGAMQWGHVLTNDILEFEQKVTEAVPMTTRTSDEDFGSESTGSVLASCHE